MTQREFQKLKRDAERKTLSRFAYFHRELAHVDIFYQAKQIPKWDVYNHCKDPFAILNNDTNFKYKIKDVEIKE